MHFFLLFFMKVSKKKNLIYVVNFLIKVCICVKYFINYYYFHLNKLFKVFFNLEKVYFLLYIVMYL